MGDGKGIVSPPHREEGLGEENEPIFHLLFQSPLALVGGDRYAMRAYRGEGCSRIPSEWVKIA